MTDQIRRLVDQGQMLNYDACFQNSTVAKIASLNLVPNDDLNMSQAKDRLCRIYYKNAFWRGGINGGIDDRVGSSSISGWDAITEQKSQQNIDTNKVEFGNNINRVHQAILSFHMYGNMNDANNIIANKAEIEKTINKLHQESEKLEMTLQTLKKENSEEMLQSVADNENKIRQMNDENDKFRKNNELRREQSKALYNRYDSNYHSSAFGYNPLNASSQSGLFFTSFFMGFIGLVVLGVQIAPMFIGSQDTIPQVQSVKKLNASRF